MSCVLNINHQIIPNDVVITLTAIYKWIGKNGFFTDTVKGDLERIVEQTVERDCYFLSRILKLNISDARMRLIITKHSVPRNKEETTLYNIKELLASIQQKYKDTRHQSNDLLNLINYLYSHYGDIKFDYANTEKRALLQSQAMKSKRLILDEINEIVESSVAKNTFEKITLYLNFYVDFYNIAPFTQHNETAALFLLYLLLFKADLEAFRFISFFEMLTQNYEEFQLELKNASFNWKEGFAQTVGFLRFMTKLILKSYQQAYDLIKDYKFDSSLNKGDNIENTITKLPDIFSKDEIRLIHPYVSESTINRALIKMRDEGSIKPLGKGRSAKWIKIQGIKND